jgi:FHS family L-fucose permease-like MFS transporter
LVVVQFFMSIMFPTIFSLGISDTSHERQWASSLLIMTIAGGAFAPPIMGWVSDHHGIAAAFGIPLLSFVVVATMGFVFKNKEV